MIKTGETYTFILNSIPIETEFRNIKTMRLTVYPDGRVKLAAPIGTAPVLISQFTASRLKWIEQCREKFRNRPARDTSLRNNSIVHVWGRAYELKLIEHDGNSRIKTDGRSMVMYIKKGSPKSKKMEVLDRWYRRTLKEIAPGIIKKWEAIIGIEVKKLYIRKMKTHWGSCNYEKQTLRLNSELVKQSPECLEYVIVHEMLHIIEKGHNRKYYLLMNKYIPDWKQIRKKMNTGSYGE